MSTDLSQVPHDLEFEATIRRLDVAQQVFDRYKLLQVLGRGGMGVVWLAHDERLERDVALKFLPDEIGLDPEAVDELKRETRRSLELTHPNIIRIYDFVKDRQAVAISMEYINGETMAALKAAKPNRYFEVEEMKPWLTQACQALRYAHDDVGIVHRDLKPANFMLTSRGQIKVADFGIAQSVSESMARTTMRRETSGTLAYMSPQQMSGETPQVTDDIYAIGATIYELLTSKPPFFSGNISFQVRVMIPPPMEERRDEFEIRGVRLPAEWESTVAACLSKSPEHRPQSMQEVAERLGLAVARPHVLKKDKSFEEEPRDSSQMIAKFNAFSDHVRKKCRSADFRFRQPRFIFSIAGAGALLTVIFIAWHFLDFPTVVRSANHPLIPKDTPTVVYRPAPVIATPAVPVAVPVPAPQGEFQINTYPSGAVAHLAGQPDETTPATFTGLDKGKYTVALSLDGYDPVEKTVELDANTKQDLGVIPLKRALGQLTISTVPRHVHYVLTGPPSATATVQQGTTPDFVSSVPSGSYSLVLTCDGFPACTEAITIPPHGKATMDIDLVRSSLTSGVRDPAALVFRGEADESALSASARDELIGFRNRAFDKYLASGMLAEASAQLDQLASMGVDISASRTALQAQRFMKEKAVADTLRRLIRSERFASASAVLQNIDGLLEKESIDRLTLQSQTALAAYEAQITTALDVAQTEAPQDAAKQLQKLVVRYPDDMRLQNKLGNVQMLLPPDHACLTAQINALRKFDLQNKDAVVDPDALKLMAVLDDELTRLDAVAKDLEQAQSALREITGHIAHLGEERDAYQNRRIGKPPVNPFASAVNFFGKAVTGHSVVDTESVFPTRAARDEAVANVESEIAAAQLTLPAAQTIVDDAQKSYNDFVSVVPWGQN